ncbi:MAG: electron transfer flavoprotein subunit alpha/FixB family protein [Candidatus Thermoplasmatota archaeon]|nr:electron transfer flavoprotein subunit alpha/FixB family protein [Candidatus Thermoplasmatota archaeon]
MVVVYSDLKRNGFELLSKARELADKRGNKVCAVVIGKDAGTQAQEYIQRGADMVIVTGSSMEHFNAEDVSDILEVVVKEERPEIVLIASTKDGKELAPRLASKLDAGCISDANKIYVDGDSILAERVVYSGNGIAVEQFGSFPGIITVPGKAFDPLPIDPGRTGEVVNRDIVLKQQRSSIVDVQKMVSEGVNVEEAEKIVSCGRGFKKSDDLKLIEELARVMNGNTLGCSRPIAADLKWLSEDHWVGLSGHKVKPKLYIACGISGQIQHVAGMRDSGIIVAINKDADAPIFNSADYGIVGDLYQVIPKLIEAIRQKM